ncbi:MAG TPA: DUF4386 domain-containing protein [Thermoanaerobaculia bacterium]|jgi:hypothetical protein
MQPTVKTARIAGALYLSMVVTGPFSLIYLPNKLIVPGNATATAGKVLAFEMLFRLGIVADLVGSVMFILLAMALYRLFSGVNKTHASLLVVLVLVSATIGFVNVLSNIAALNLFRGADFLTAFDKPQRDALGMLFLRLHGQGNVINEIFWGLWLFPFGVLVMRSRFLPRLLGVLLIVNCFAYLAISLTSLLFPDYGNLLFRASQPALFGELWIMLYLLIKGMRQEPVAAVAA